MPSGRQRSPSQRDLLRRENASLMPSDNFCASARMASSEGRLSPGRSKRDCRRRIGEIRWRRIVSVAAACKRDMLMPQRSHTDIRRRRDIRYQTPPRPEPMPGDSCPGRRPSRRNAPGDAAASAVSRGGRGRRAGDADHGIGVVGLFVRLEGFENGVLAVAALCAQSGFQIDAHQLDAGRNPERRGGVSPSASFMKSPNIGAAIAPPVLPLPSGFGVS